MTSLHVHDHGSDGPPLLLLHGLGRSHADWEPVAALLGSTYRVLAVDLPGHGSSPDLSPWSMPGVVDLLVEVLDAHGVPQAVVVGHSLGGMVAVEFAREHPERVRAAVNLDGFWWGWLDHPGAERLGGSLRTMAGAVAPPEYLRQQVAHSALYGIPAERAEATARAAARPLPDGRWQTLPERAAALELYDELDRIGRLGVAAWLAGVKPPLLQVQAAKSYPSRPGREWFDELMAEFTRVVGTELTALAEARPETVFRRIDAGHPMNLEVPDEVAALVAEFVDGLPG